MKMTCDRMDRQITSRSVVMTKFDIRCIGTLHHMHRALVAARELEQMSNISRLF